MSEKPTLNIVLVEPRIPQNTGNVARTCACTACRLHLVGPMGFAIDDKKLKHAGLDYWHYLDISYYDSLDDFFSKNDGPFYYFTTKAPQRYTDIAYPDGAYLVFGREDAGLPEALLAANQEHCIRTPADRRRAALPAEILPSDALFDWHSPCRDERHPHEDGRHRQ